MKMRNPNISLNILQENDNVRQVENQESLNKCSLLVFSTLQTEHEYLISEANLQVADAFWSVARQRAIANDPTACKAQKECQEIRNQFLAICEQKKTYSHLASKAQELKNELNKANNLQAKAENHAIKNDGRVLKAVFELTQARTVHNTARDKLEQAQDSLLQTLEREFQLKLTWNNIESLLDIKTKALIVEICLQLAEMQNQQNQQLNEMAQSLYSYTSLKLRQQNNGIIV